ncbi:MAG: hypothetical protein CMM46_02000 [Rhodospirillaceae bacterium]|nr:hypothetical protein [Rhodospirillaceae bacterium]|tara:strand:- start:5084 stop:5635 length:552 start_codon:yes stop_codon:yes gene_type:complete
MIGRFSRALDGILPATLVAGVILVIIGVWFATEPYRFDYPEESDLVAVEGEAFDAIEVRRRRGAFLRFMVDDPLEYQAVFNPGERLVLYYSSMPNYDAVTQAIGSGPAIFWLWQDAGDETDSMIVWQLENADGIVVSRDATVAGFAASRQEAAKWPGAIALFGVLLTIMGLRARARAKRGLGA